MSEAAARRPDWINISFLMLTPLIGVGGTAYYTWRVGLEPWMPLLLVGMYLAVGLSICAGYHRLFSHRSYSCSRPVQAVLAFFGAMAAQNSILAWCSGHRAHHRYVDRDWDPYNIRRGFWWAHILWVFYKAPEDAACPDVRDLENNPIVRWQDRWYRPILLLGGFGIPLAIGAAFGHPLGGLLWGGFLRIAVIHHTTFFVNSLAHSLGTPRFDADVSARDNGMVALLTLGEGYHSFHHRFPSDFRNGVRWYHWDPAKWFIRGLAAVGLASNPRRTPAHAIARAWMQAEARRIEGELPRVAPDRGVEIRRLLDRAKTALEHSVTLWKRHIEEREKGVAAAWRLTRRRSNLRLRQARRRFRDATRRWDAIRQAA
jgi:stearoyl-CoA desaturase (delta-9 desaturase)